MSTISSLEVRLNDLLVGYLTHYPDEKTVFVIDEGYIEYGEQRPILSLSLARPNDEESTRALLSDDRHKSASVKAPPFFSNLLPEGGLRRSIAQRLKVHEDREFLLLSALGEDLPGAVILTPVDTPDHLKRRRGGAVAPTAEDLQELKFSLGGMQMKFSMLRQGERFTLAGGKKLGNYIVKPPSNDFEALPMVEAATMETARAAGMDVPEIQLLTSAKIQGLPNMAGFRQGEPFYAIRRFDRPDGGRIHVEDFAQVFNLRTHQKYGRVNYDMIGRTLLVYAGGLFDLKEMARRLVLNVLMGNGDAHIKNWALIYDNPLRPRLAPAYDLVSTVAYTAHDTSVALNMGGVKLFKVITLDTFADLFRRIGIVDQVLEEVMEEVKVTGRRVLDVWRNQFQATGVPEHLLQKIDGHQAELPLAKTLNG
jgi:serine/threonine-protein kinase HipA